MSVKAPQEQASDDHDEYRGAQREVIVRGSGFLSVVGAVASLALVAFYPPTAEIGAAGWAVVLPACVLSIVPGIASLTLRRRPGMTEIMLLSFFGIIEIGLLEWLAGGGRAPYLQLLLLPVLGSACSQSPWRCAQAALLAVAVSLSPLLYSTVNVAATVTEFSLLSVMAVMTAITFSSTRAHRARLRDAGEHANTLAHLDPLTGMPNRRAFDEALVEAIASAARASTSVSLLLCDVNSFKQVNDTFGHAAGDEVLQSIARTLSDAVRRPDTAFRWAGDEFAVILRDSDELGASRVAARIRRAVARECRRPDGGTVSIGTGVAAVSDGMSAEQVLAEADRALFCQKARQREHEPVGAA
jgi:diguanylate cyclase (GGDEF)-like protein